MAANGFDFDGFEEFSDVYTTSADAEESGMWVPMTPEVWLKIRRATSKAFVAATLAANKRFEAYERAGQEVPDEHRSEATLDAIANGMIADWWGINRKGERVPYSPAEGKAFLTTFPNVRRAVTIHATEMANYREANIKALEGNLPPGLSS